MCLWGGQIVNKKDTGKTACLENARQAVFLKYSGRSLQLVDPAAGDKVPGEDLLLFLGLVAGVRGVGTAGGEAAAGRRIDGGGDLAVEDLPLVGVVDVHRRDGREQCLGVGVHWVAEQLLGGTLFHHLAQVHHADVVRDVPDHRHVMGDEHVGEPPVLL